MQDARYGQSKTEKWRTPISSLVSLVEIESEYERCTYGPFHSCIKILSGPSCTENTSEASWSTFVNKLTTFT